MEPDTRKYGRLRPECHVPGWLCPGIANQGKTKEREVGTSPAGIAVPQGEGVQGKGKVQLTVGDGLCATSPLPGIGGTVFCLVLTPRLGGWDK